MASWKFVKEKKTELSTKMFMTRPCRHSTELTNDSQIFDRQYNFKTMVVSERMPSKLWAHAQFYSSIHTYNSYYSIWKYVIGGDVVLFAFWRQSVCVCVCMLSVWPTFRLLSHSEEERIGMHAQYKRFPLRFLYLVVYFTCSLSLSRSSLLE